MSPTLCINGRRIGPGYPVYVISELSANHGQDFDQAVRTIRAMKRAGADAVKLQTYTADTLTLASDQPWFRIGGGTLWDGRTLHSLYQEAYMPWEWQPRLQEVAAEEGLDFFSSPFDATAVDFLEGMKVPCHKIASFELVDLSLLRRVGATRKPVIASTGMATLEEIQEAISTLRGAGCSELALLKCTSAYPASPKEMNLRTLADLAARFGVPVGLSDHTMGPSVPIAAVALGACIVEKHFTLSRDQGGPDSAFSLEPEEFRTMVEAIRTTEQALGGITYSIAESEVRSRQFRRSLFVVQPVRKGEVFTGRNVRSIRPSNGLHTRELPRVLGAKAASDLETGTPLAEEQVDCSGKVVAIIQARMGSSRLPGKVLRRLGDATVLEHVIRRVQEARNVDQVLVATTDQEQDQAIVAECERIGVLWFRGSESDVLSRFAQAARSVNAAVIVRVTSDCPLIDGGVLQAMLQHFTEASTVGSPLDYLSNVHPRTFPRGLDAEIFTRAGLEKADREATQPHEREHVTPFFYQHPDLFVLGGHVGDEDLSAHRWTLDTPEDWELLQRVYSAMGGRSSFGTAEVLALLKSHPDWVALNSGVEQRALGS